MKKQAINSILAFFILISGWTVTQAQDQIEVPGDNFSLEGALELFKKSGSPEEFEKMLNDPEVKVNNLDLNGDKYIDYIKVIDRNEGNVHLFIMQAVVSENQLQDIAVITLEKLANGKARLQITGDEDVYGVETIIEPTTEVSTYGGTRTTRAVVNVWAWPSVQYIYGPHYSAWISPWGWGYRPVWWSPWRPIAYYNYYPYWSPYYAYYSPCYVHRSVYYQNIYRPYRTTSVVVINRHSDQVRQYRSSRINQVNNSGNRASGSSGRSSATSVRYNTNGRLSTSNNSSVNSRSSSSRSDGARSAVRSETSSSRNTQSRSDLRTNSESSEMQRYSRSRSTESSGSYTTGARQKGSASERTSVPSTERKSSSEGTNTQRYQRSSTPSNSNSRSYGSSNKRSSSPNVQRSTGSSNSRKSSGSYNSQRSSSGSSAVQRSSGSSGSRSSGYSSAPRSSGSSSAPSSAGRSSSGSSQRSSGSSQRGGRQ